MRRANPIVVTMLVVVAALVADGCSRRRAASVPQPQPAPPFEPCSLWVRVGELGGSLHFSRPDGLNVVMVVEFRMSCG